MIADRSRAAAYKQALLKALKPGAVVLDLGAGTGIFALVATQLGARKVYVVEPDDVIQLAREIAADNEVIDQIEFLQDLSTKINLPEQVDVIVSDLRGVLPLFQHHIKSIIDARQRLLSPGGLLIPERDTLWAAVVDDPEMYAEYVGPWSENCYELDLGRAQKVALNNWRKKRVGPNQLLVDPKSWATLDYRTILSPDVHAELNWSLTRDGTGHGFIIWFDTVLVEGVEFSTGPDGPEMIYGQAFFPWLEPVDLKIGDKVILDIAADLVGEDYVWRWNTRIISGDKPDCLKASFKQSTFFGVPLSADRLRKQSAHHLPVLNDDGNVEYLILSLMNGNTSLEEIAHQLHERLPKRFTNWNDALTLICELSMKYSW